MENKESMEPDFWTPDEVARFLRVTRRTVTEWLNASKLQGHQLANNRWIVPTSAVREFLEAGSNAPSEAVVAAQPAASSLAASGGVGQVNPLANRKNRRRR